MALLRVRKYGDPVLRRRAKPVGDVTQEIRDLLRDMVATMYAEGGLGLAAPQVGISLRVIVVDDERAGGARALINPVIVDQGGRVLAEEGCLSIPGFYGPVARAERVRVAAHDADGTPLTLDPHGLFARVIQHELDHLDGVLFIDHLEPVLRDRIKRAIKKEGLPDDVPRRALAL